MFCESALLFITFFSDDIFDGSETFLQGSVCKTAKEEAGRRDEQRDDGGWVDDEEPAGMPWCAGRGALVQEDEKVCGG